MPRIFLFIPCLLLILTPLHAQTPYNIDSMTLEQKVAQMFLVALYGPTLNAPGRDFLQQWQPGGAVIFSSNAGTPDSVTRLTNSWQQTVIDAGGVPMFIATDQEGGTITRLKDGFTTWPVPMLLTASGDVSLAYRVGQAMANELSAVGVNMNLAPVADLYTNLRNPIIGRRSFGSDPERTGQMLAALIRGMQAGGILSTAKHFPGHGDTDSDSHTSLPIINRSREELDTIELAPFRWTVAAGVETVMVAHIWYPAIDPSGEIPASLSSNVVSGLLRNEMNFQGLIMTDAIMMDAIDTRYDYDEASIMAIEAGVDLIAFGAHLPPTSQGRAMQGVVDAVRSGRISETRINESVRRILDAKQRYGLLDWQPLDPDTASQRIFSKDHETLVTELFRAGVTVAYDKNGVIPLDNTRKVAVVYSRSAVRRNCEPYHPADLTRWVTVAESPDGSQIQSAVSAASWADTVVVFTQNAGSNIEQQRLVQALPADKTVAVALFSPYDWQAFPDVSAYVTTYSPLDPGIPEVCGLLFGAFSSSAKLPVSLDGAREFTNGTVVAFAPSITPLPSLTPTPLETATLTPTPFTPTPTNTREPLAASTRSAALIPTPGAAPSIEPETLVVAEVMVAPEATATSEPPSPVVFLGGGAFALAVIYAGMSAQGQKAMNRYQNGFVVDRCPVCRDAGLKIECKAKKTMGITRQVRHTVRCTACNSTLREIDTGKWKYHVNEGCNPAFYRKYHNHVIDDVTLKSL